MSEKMIPLRRRDRAYTSRELRDKTMMSTRVSWSDIPTELLELIARLLYTKQDVTRLRAVCKSWRSSIGPFQDPSPSTFPLRVPVIVPDRGPHCHVLTRSKLYCIQPPQQVAAASTSSSTAKGWLFKVQETPQAKLQFLHPLFVSPFKKKPRSFPEVINSLNYNISELGTAYMLQSYCCRCYKGVLSFNSDGKGPSLSESTDPAFMSVACGVLCHLNLRDANWTLVTDPESALGYEDVIYYDGHFCAVDDCGRAVVIHSDLAVSTIAPNIYCEEEGRDHRQRLVKSFGDLILVDGYPKRNPTEFKVFKIDWGEKKWVRINSLGDRVLFLGEDCSFAVSVQDVNGFKANCIYFTDSKYRGNLGVDVRVFSLEDGRCMVKNNWVDGISAEAEHRHGSDNPFWPPPTWLCRR